MNYAGSLWRDRNRHPLFGPDRVTGSNRFDTAAIAEMDNRLAGKSAATTLTLFSTLTHTDVGPFVRNVNFWGVDIVAKFTCVSPSNSNSGDGQLHGTAITARHVLYAAHATPVDGTTIRFVNTDNTIVLRTQSKNFTIPNTDFNVGLLSSDLPATITPCKSAPDNLLLYINTKPSFPLIVVDQEKKGLIYNTDEIEPNVIRGKTPVEAQRLAFNETIIAGDSGGPWFCIINGELVLMSVTTGTLSGGFCYGNPVIGLTSNLNSAIVSVDALGSVSTGYTVTNPSLGAFSTIN